MNDELQVFFCFLRDLLYVLYALRIERIVVAFDGPKMQNNPIVHLGPDIY